MECNLCKQIKQPSKDCKYPCYSCDSCRNTICLECSKLSASEIRCLPISGQQFKFCCSKCRNYDLVDILNNQIKDKDQIIKDKEEIIELLKTKIREYENTPIQQSTTYAQVTKGSAQLHQINYPKIIIKPKAPQNHQKTKDDVEKNIKLDELKVGIQSMTTLNSGSIVIKCRNKQEMDILEENIKNKLNDNYDVQLSKMRKPKIKIVNFNQEMSYENIKKCIMDQNNLDDGIEVVFIKKPRNGNKTVICECSPEAFSKIMREGRLSIGWERYTVYEDLDIPRCYQCQGYYHNKHNCINKIVCSLCAKEHSRENSPKDKLCCVNCKNSNIKFKTNYPIDHHAIDLECNMLKYYKQALRNKTTYCKY